MARGKHRLRSIQVEKAKTPGWLADGDGLYLQVSKSADGEVRKSWVVRYRAPSRKVREMGLGPADVLSLADARKFAEDARKLAAVGVDPIDARKAARAEAEHEQATALTFKQAAEAYVDAHEAGWRNPKHRQQWRNTLATYAYPKLGEVLVRDVDRRAVLQAVEPIWASKTETASRILSRILTVLEWSVARGYRTADDPAAWRPYLRKALPPRSKIHTVEHHPALPFVQMPKFMPKLRATGGVSARALELVILCAVRTNEALKASWSEIDLKGATWVIPAERMKSRREHRVPLSPRAVAILKEMRKLSSGPWVFPGRGSEPLSNMALLMVLRRMKRGDVVTHGFRSTFRDWAAEQTSFPREVAEQALAHVLSDKTEAAYRRSDLFDKRRALMDAWALFCIPEARTAKKTAVRRAAAPSQNGA